MYIPKSMYDHFSQVAPNYRKVRNTDEEPIAFIRETLNGLPQIQGADIACGAGRYDLLLFEYIKNLYLTCIDINECMLKQVSDYLRTNGISNFKTYQGS